MICLGILQQSSGVDLKCEYSLLQIWSDAGRLYTCTSRDVGNKNNQLMITGALGLHKVHEQLQSVKQLWIISSNIPTMPEGLGYFQNLIGLIITHSKVKNIQSKHFQGLENLLYLTLANNNIKNIPIDSFQNLKDLKFIDLSSNSIKRLQCETFQSNVKLEQIWLKHNIIEYLGKLIFTYSKDLKIIYLFNNTCVNQYYSGKKAIVELKDGIQSCLEQNEQMPIPTTMSPLDDYTQKLRNIIKSRDNEIKILNAEKKELSDQINELNAIKDIPDSVQITCDFNLIDGDYSCNTTDHHFNRFNMKSYEFNGQHKKDQKDKDVVTLIMENMSMIYVANDIFKTFRNLQKVTFNNLRLRQLSRGDFEGAGNVYDLTMKDNEIKKLEECVFKGAEKLEFIVMDSNLIEHVYEKTFDGLDEIKKISLRNNKIKKLHKDTFQNLVNLKELILTSNQLSFLDGKLLRNCKSLVKLHCDQNVLREIGEDFLSFSESLTFVNFKDNLCLDEGTKGYLISDLTFMIRQCCKKPQHSLGNYNCGKEGWT